MLGRYFKDQQIKQNVPEFSISLQLLVKLSVFQAVSNACTGSNLAWANFLKLFFTASDAGNVCLTCIIGCLKNSSRINHIVSKNHSDCKLLLGMHALINNNKQIKLLQ
jgi:hypothetical protein